ncbi:MAG: isochorismatase family protein [Nostoc sp.]|uniref:isochorismatase family protein n=1 Tax=Nostoc sp. TaxID=1180 RepID=UPI002FFC5C05
MSKLSSGCRPYQLPGTECLQYNRVQWQVMPSRAALLIHDMQKYYLRPLMGESEKPGRRLIENVKAIREACVAAHIPVIYTVASPCERIEQRGLLYDFWGGGMTNTVDDTEIVDEIKPDYSCDRIIVKHKYSAFYKSNLADTLKALKTDQLIITGVYSHIGCMATALDALMRDIQVFYVGDAVGDFSVDFHMSSIATIGNCCGQIYLTEMLKEALLPKTERNQVLVPQVGVMRSPLD